jgi:hypothetical protein
VGCATQNCLVTWSDRTIDPHWALNSRSVDSNLNLLGASDTPLLADQADHYLPRLALGANGYLLTWSDETLTSEYGVGGIPLDGNGNVLPGGGVLTSNIATTDLRPAVAWDGTTWWVAWRNDRSPLPVIELARLSANGSPIASLPGPEEGFNSPHDPALAFDGVHMWLVYALDVLGGSRVDGLRYGTDGFPIDAPLQLSLTSVQVSAPVLAGDAHGAALLVWIAGEADGGSTLHHRLLSEAASDGGVVAVDAGTDGGVDAGPGSNDGGHQQPGSYRVGCGCDASSGALALAALLWLTRRRLKWGV